MSYKKLIPCIFIDEGKAVKWFDNREVLSENVVSLAKYYSDHGADELFVFDLSSSDEEHEEDQPGNTHSDGGGRKYQAAGRYQENLVCGCETGSIEFLESDFL